MVVFFKAALVRFAIGLKWLKYLVLNSAEFRMIVPSARWFKK